MDGSNNEQQIFLLFKKLHLAIMGIIVALLLLNIMLSEDKSLLSVIGIEQEEEPQPNDNKIFTVNFFETFKE
jgi:hypothetical protein